MNITICGAGIAGLYTAYKLLLINPETKITILEKNKYIGGRINVTAFAGTFVPIGAGIGRKSKDKLLLELLDTFGLKYTTGTSSSQYLGHTQINSKQIVQKLIDAYKQNPVHETFKVFALRYLSNEEYNNFIKSTGYSDFTHTDIYEVLYNYGIDDTYNTNEIVYLPWNELIKSLVNFIKSKGGQIKLGYTVTKFKNNTLYYIKTSDLQNNINIKDIDYTIKDIDYTIKDNKFKYITIDTNSKLIVATTICHLQYLLPSYKIYKSIGSTPFMRIYGQFSKKTRTLISQTVSKLSIVNKPIQKIIPINPPKGVYMIIYNDNESAIKIYNKLSKLNNTSNKITSNNLGAYVPRYNQACIDYLEDLLVDELKLNKNDVELTKIAVYFWREGTHYFKPLASKYNNFDEFIHEAQRPSQNVYVVGEAVAKYKGWSEGALESVQNIISGIM